MNHQFEDTGFARLYVWVARAKYTMGIFYVLFVFVYLLFGLISEGPAVTLNLFTAIQMGCACFLIGFAQQGIAPKEKLTKVRCLLWVLTGVVIAVAFSLAFGWFAAFPLWCPILFFVFLVLSMTAMLLSSFLELHRETRVLNRQLGRFQKKPAGEERICR